MTSQQFIPLNELPPNICELGEYLPAYAQPDHIGINMQRLGKLASIGGFYPDVSIVCTTSQETEMPGVASYDADGTATLMLSRSSVASSLVNPIISDTQAANFRPRRELSLQLRVNELTDQVQRTGPQAIRNPNVWSSHINKALRTGINQAAWQNLTGRPLPVGECAATFLYSTIATCELSLLPSAPFEMEAIFIAAIGSGALSAVMITKAMFGISHLTKESYVSAVPIWYVDRALTVSALSCTRKLVAPVAS